MLIWRALRGAKRWGSRISGGQSERRELRRVSYPIRELHGGRRDQRGRLGGELRGVLGAGRDDALGLLVVRLEEVMDEVRRHRDQVREDEYSRDGAERREPGAARGSSDSGGDTSFSEVPGSALSTFCRLTHF